MIEKNIKKNEFGLMGENIATEFLLSNGYLIIERNWRYRHKEIDIIASKNNTLVIVEVKTRSSANIAMPHSAVNREKQRFLIEAANNYVVKRNLDVQVRFDVIAIWFESNKRIIDHLEDAFYPRW